MKITKNSIEKETVIVKKASFFKNTYGQYKVVINGQMYDTDILGNLFTKKLMDNDYKDSGITCENKKEFVLCVLHLIQIENED